MSRPFRIVSQRRWQVLKDELRKRFVEPWLDPTFVLYFVVIILGIGGLGIWLGIGKWWIDSSEGNLSAIPQQISTYLIAIAAGAFVDLTFLTFVKTSVNDSSEAVLPDDTRSSLWMFVFGLFAICVLFAVISSQSFRLRWTFGCSILGTIAALFIWWLANYGNRRLRYPPPLAVAGGDTDEIAGTSADVQEL